MSMIVVGVMEENERFPPSLTNDDEGNGEFTLLVNGLNRSDLFYTSMKKIPKGLDLVGFGDCIGICFHY